MYSSTFDPFVCDIMEDLQRWDDCQYVRNDPVSSVEYENVIACYEEIESLNADYVQLCKGEVCDFRSAQILLFERANDDPAAYCLKLAQCAWNAKDANIEQILEDSSVSNSSVAEIASFFELWYWKVHSSIPLAEAAITVSDDNSHESWQPLFSAPAANRISVKNEDMGMQFASVTAMPVGAEMAQVHASEEVETDVKEQGSKKRNRWMEDELMRWASDELSDSEGCRIPDMENASDSVIHSSELVSLHSDEGMTSSGEDETIPAASNPQSPVAPARGAGSESLQRRKRMRRKSSASTSIKGVYTTPHGFRVQLNMRPVLDSMHMLHRSAKGNIKFSRNCKRYRDALWLYEAVVLLSDRPRSLDDIISRGNYGALRAGGYLGEAGVQLGHGPTEYYEELGKALSSLRDAGILFLEEWNEALLAYQCFSAPVVPSTAECGAEASIPVN